MHKTGIYQITNLLTQKIYIGSCVNSRKRWNCHKYLANKNKHGSITFQRSWTLHGEEAFRFDIIETCEKEKLIEREQYWLDKLAPCNPDMGYNICKIAGSTLGKKHTKETTEKLRLMSIGKTQSKETVNKRILNVRKLDKWPCEKGSLCKCQKCRKIKSDYQNRYNERKRNAANI